MSTIYERQPSKYCGPNKQLCKNTPSEVLQDVSKAKAPPEGKNWLDGINTFIKKIQGVKHLENFEKVILVKNETAAAGEEQPPLEKR